MLLVWAPEKDFFTWEHAEALSQAFPDARLERIDDSLHVRVGGPAGAARELIAEFAREPVAA